MNIDAQTITTIEALKNKVASLTGETSNHFTAFNVLTSRWKTLVSDIKSDLKTNLENGEISKDFHDFLQTKLDFVHENVSYANAVGLHDVAEHLRPVSEGSVGLSPAELTPLVPIPTGDVVSVTETGTVEIVQDNPTPPEEAKPTETVDTAPEPVSESNAGGGESTPIMEKVEEIQAKLTDIKKKVNG